jgi:hypothetical protein
MILTALEIERDAAVAMRKSRKRATPDGSETDDSPPRNGALRGSDPLQEDELERAERIASGRIEASDLDWLRKGFSAFLAGVGAVPLERCLRLPRHDFTLRRAFRDYWLCRAWNLVPGQLSPWRRSDALAAAVRAFESQQWTCWSAGEDAPASATDLQIALFRAYRSRVRVPLTAMQLHNIAYRRRHPPAERDGSASCAASRRRRQN